jgi:hypothetical protein
LRGNWYAAKQAIAVKYHQFFHNMTPEGMEELEEAITISRNNGSDTELM